MTKMPERLAFWGGLLQLIFALLAWAIGSWTQSRTVTAAAAYLFLGCAFWFFSCIHSRQQRLAAAERKEEAELARKYRDEDTRSIFDGKERLTDQFSAVVQLGKIERIFLPILVVILGAAYLALAIFIISGKFAAYPVPAQEQFLVAAIFVAVIAFVSFLYSKYVIGISQRTEFQVLKAPGLVMLSGSFFFLVVTVTLLAGHLNYLKFDLIISKIIAVIMILIGVEMGINFIVSLYRPFGGRKGENPVYYSRIVATLTGPRNIFKATASTLDYQFGFKVSETWFYQFLERAAAPLFLFLVLSLYLLSAIVIVQPHQRVIIERFGKPLGDGKVFGPGLHLKIPWPIDIARTFDVDRVQTIVIGPRHGEYDEAGDHDRHEHEDGKESHRTEAILWTEKHAVQEFTIMVAAKPESGQEKEEGFVPANLLSLAFNIHYCIRDDPEEIYKYAYNNAEPEKILYDIASRELVRYAVSADYEDMLGPGRQKASETLLYRIQQRADNLTLGVKIKFAELAGVHPPVEIAAAYEAVIGAEEERKSKILEAEAEAHKIKNLARGKAEKIKAQDKGLAYRQKETTRAGVLAFESQLAAYRTAPEVFKSRLYLDTLVESMSGVRKYIYPAGEKFKAIFNLDLEIKKSPFITDITTKAEEPK